ncbi:MAG: hypothetical protein V4631_20965 [Pseudomonadota bacterium]
MTSKYIAIKAKDGQELLFTFPDTVMHLHMLEAVRHVKQGVPANWVRPYRDAECVGAGFVMDGRCYGLSTSLDVKSRHDVDTALLARGSQT